MLIGEFGGQDPDQFPRIYGPVPILNTSFPKFFFGHSSAQKSGLVKGENEVFSPYLNHDKTGTRFFAPFVQPIDLFSGEVANINFRGGPTRPFPYALEFYPPVCPPYPIRKVRNTNGKLVLVRLDIPPSAHPADEILFKRIFYPSHVISIRLSRARFLSSA